MDTRGAERESASRDECVVEDGEEEGSEEGGVGAADVRRTVDGTGAIRGEFSDTEL